MAKAPPTMLRALLMKREAALPPLGDSESDGIFICVKIFGSDDKERIITKIACASEHFIRLKCIMFEHRGRWRNAINFHEYERMKATLEEIATENGLRLYYKPTRTREGSYVYAITLTEGDVNFTSRGKPLERLV